MNTTTTYTEIRQLERDGWIPLKTWKIEEAERALVSASAIGVRLARGQYQGRLALKRINPRVIFVKPQQP